MPIELREFVQERPELAGEQARVRELATRLRDHLDSPTAQEKIASANQPGASSVSIQSVFRDFALELGFVDESRGLFVGYDTSALRPDYFLRLDGTRTSRT